MKITKIKNIMENIMTFTQPIEDFVNKPTKRGSAKSSDTISTYRGAFNRIFQHLGVTETQLTEGSFDDENFISAIRESGWKESTQLQTAKIAWMYLKSLEKERKLLTEFVDELEAKKRLRRGEVRSDDEHEEHYADTEGKLEVVEKEVEKYLEGLECPSGNMRESILLAAYLMLIVPLRPSEAVSIYIGSGKENYLDLEKREIVINEQKSKTVGERRIAVPELFCKLAESRKGGWLFPSLRAAATAGEPMTRTDFTKQLVHSATLEFFGKSVSSRDLRTSVISNKVKYENGGLTPLEQVKFAKECGHTHETQIDHYNVFVKPSEAPQPKTKITIRPKVVESPPSEPVPAPEVKTEPKFALLLKIPKPKVESTGRCSRSWDGSVFKLENISFQILEQISNLIPDDMKVEADCNETRYCVTLHDVKLKLYVEIEKLFVGNQVSP
jgi:hypothetical protein